MVRFHLVTPMARPAPETDLQNEGRLCIGSLPFVRLYRNNVGTLEDRNGTPVSYGLAVGSADTIGIVAPTGRFLSIEWKRPGWKPPELTAEDFDTRAVLSKEKKRHRDQCNWRAQINAMGGVAGFAQSLEDGVRLLWWARSTLDIGEPLLANQQARQDEYVTQIVNEFRERMAERGKRKSNRDR